MARVAVARHMGCTHHCCRVAEEEHGFERSKHFAAGRGFGKVVASSLAGPQGTPDSCSKHCCCPNHSCRFVEVALSSHLVWSRGPKGEQVDTFLLYY